MTAYGLATDPSGLYFGSNASGLVNVAADNANVNYKVTADTVICNNLNVKGTTTTTTVANLQVTNAIIECAVGNTTADAIYTGVLAHYKPAATAAKMAGLIRNPGGGEFMLVKDGTTLGITDYVGATLVLDQVHSTSINNVNDTSTATLHVTGTSNMGLINCGNVNANAGDFSSLSTQYTSGTNTVLGSATVGALSATSFGVTGTSNMGLINCGNVNGLAGDFTSLSTQYTSGTNVVLGSATVGALSATSFHSTGAVVYDTTVHGPHSTLDDGTGHLTNSEVDTVSLNVSGTSNLENVHLYGSMYAYPGVPFSTIPGPGVVPTLQVDGFGVTTAEVVSLGVTTTANPLDLIPLLGTITSYGAPYCRMSALGNIVAHGVGMTDPVVTGQGNITATGAIKGGANCSFGSTNFSGTVVVNAGGIVSGIWTLENDGNTLFGTAGGGVIGVGSDTKIYGRIQFGDVTQYKDKVVMYNPVDVHGPITTGPRSIAFNGPLPDLLTF